MNRTWKVSECAVILMALVPAVLDGQVQPEQIDKLYKRWEDGQQQLKKMNK